MLLSRDTSAWSGEEEVEKPREGKQQQEEEDASQERWQLLSRLKSTVEVLVGVGRAGVWTCYGGLEHLTAAMHAILEHGLHAAKCQPSSDVQYWPFILSLQSVAPQVCPCIVQDSAIGATLEEAAAPPGTVTSGSGDSSPGARWLRESLERLGLAPQLRPLLAHRAHVLAFYSESAFVLSDVHVTAMLHCLDALEQNSMDLLTEISTALLCKGSVGLLAKGSRPSGAALLGRATPLAVGGTPAAARRRSWSLAVSPGAGRGAGPGDARPRRHTLTHVVHGIAATAGTTGTTTGTAAASLTAAPPSAGGAVHEGDPRGDAKGAPAGERHVVTRPVGNSLCAGTGTEQEMSWLEMSHSPIGGGDSATAAAPCSSTPADPRAAGAAPFSAASSPRDADDGPEYFAVGGSSRGRSCSSSSSSSSSSTSTSSSLASLPTQASLPIAVNSGAAAAAAETRQQQQEQEGMQPWRKGKQHKRSQSDVGPARDHRHDGAFSSSREACSQALHSDTAPRPAADGAYGWSRKLGEGLQLRRPSEGQSLLSYLSEQDFAMCADLEKENAHFSISESLIAAIELMKCNLLGDRGWELEVAALAAKEAEAETAETAAVGAVSGPECLDESDGWVECNAAGAELRVEEAGAADTTEPLEVALPAASSPSESSDLFVSTESCLSSCQSWKNCDTETAGSVREASSPLGSLTSSLQSSESLMSLSGPPSSCANSAEAVAMGLLRRFQGMQLPAASELDWLVTEEDAPQKLLPMPGSVPICPDDGEHSDVYKLRIRVRGNLEWAPPRAQIIFDIHPSTKKKVILAKQNSRCAGCGTKVDSNYIKRLRYCEYLGKLFCQCCQSGSVAVVPGRLLRRWDASRYPVSNFARELLARIGHDPLYNLMDINPQLYRRVKALTVVQELRKQLVHLKHLLQTCRHAESILATLSSSVPGHLTEEVDLYSLEDLLAVRRGELAPTLRQMVTQTTQHVRACQLCQARGFICEFCQKEEDILFPFELTRCQQCPGCRACYHKCCFAAAREDCPRCKRILARRQRLAQPDIDG
ncbi:LOW QUALITY PROTEIN: run domain Beclin-1-interacting and cysteine-rich domain-containing protein-like [Lethenteron reissneri]|uniref:LOW QUALITY PROTEIN: run domain Beclin-1-interacting and cysteine-rich domain-containing protein-like n=1 Tax=Lethenteron reissneri TaxID=7753 RepID=UPI002AB63609|nr:LOW QUALITY PROTEIN: run domain Beclin-1-interacting and cysteine-rich domain-containing protein-like [Lethenteron reissneri]